MAKEPKYIRDLEGIAKLAGMKLLTQRNRRLAQLAEVRAWTAAPGFPAKDARTGFWPRGAVLKFISEKMEDGRWKMGKASGKKPSSILHPPSSSAELPPQEKPAEGELFGEVKAARMAGILAEWTSGKPTEHFKKKYSVQELLSAGIPKEDLAMAGIIKEGNSTPGNIDLYRAVNQSRLAEILTETFNEIVYPMRVKRALEKGMPGKQKNQSIIPAVAIEWWRVNEAKQAMQGTLLAEATEAELHGKIANEKHEAFLREKERGEYVRAEAMLAFIESTEARDTGAVDKLIEDRGGVRAAARAVLARMGKLTPEEIEQFDALFAPELVAANEGIKRLHDETLAARQAKLKELQQAEVPAV